LVSCQVRVRVPTNNFDRRGKRGKGEESGYKDNKKDPAPSGLGLCWVRKKRDIGAGGEGKEGEEKISSKEWSATFTKLLIAK